MFSKMGGMDVEAVAEKDPEAMRTLHVDPLIGFQDFQGRRLAFEAGIASDVIRPVGALLSKLYDAFVAEDAMLVEVNPLLVTKAREVVALDAKVTVDGNALFRHPDHAEFQGGAAEDPQEQMARERGLTYVKLDGDIGILGNGAGLVMSTLDVVAQAGGKPANFLDAGGGSKAEAITQAVEVILSDDKVKAVLFNIFGGITRCDEVAKGLIEAFAQIKPDGAVRGAPERHQRGGGPEAAGRGRPAQRAHRDDDERRRREGRRGGKRLMAVLVDENTKLCVSGITGSEGTFHSLNNRKYGTQVVSGVTPGKGGQDVEGIPVFNTFHDAVEETGANTAMIFVPPPLRRRLDPRGRGRRHRPDRGDHRGHPRPRRAARLQPPQARQLAPGGPQLPRHPLARQGQRGHHPRVLLQGGQRGRGLALGHADLPDRLRAGPERLRQQLDRRASAATRCRAPRSWTSSSCSRPTPRPS